MREREAGEWGRKVSRLGRYQNHEELLTMKNNNKKCCQFYMSNISHKYY